MKFKNPSPGNHENIFALSINANTESALYDVSLQSFLKLDGICKIEFRTLYS